MSKRAYIRNKSLQSVTVRGNVTYSGWKIKFIKIRVNNIDQVILSYDDAIRLADEIYGKTAEYRFLKTLKGIS